LKGVVSMSRKISRLCLNCPNFNEKWPDEGDGTCKGYYSWEAEGACRTFRAWRGGKMSFSEARKAKERQHRRHKNTDFFREKTIDLILRYQGYDDNQDQADRFIKRQAKTLASRIAKGENAFKVFRDVQEKSSLYLPRRLCTAIEDRRHRITG